MADANQALRTAVSADVGAVGHEEARIVRGALPPRIDPLNSFEVGGRRRDLFRSGAVQGLEEVAGPAAVGAGALFLGGMAAAPPTVLGWGAAGVAGLTRLFAGGFGVANAFGSTRATWDVGAFTSTLANATHLAARGGKDAYRPVIQSSPLRMASPFLHPAPHDLASGTKALAAASRAHADELLALQSGNAQRVVNAHSEIAYGRSLRELADDTAAPAPVPETVRPIDRSRELSAVAERACASAHEDAGIVDGLPSPR